MDKQEANNRLQAIEKEVVELKKIINEPENKISKEERFLELISGLTVKFDNNKYSDSMFLFKENTCFFEHDRKNECLYCNSYNVWYVFENEYGMKYDDIQSLIKGQMEKYFKWGELTPSKLFEQHRKRWKNISNGK